MSLPKSRRVLRSSEFRNIYETGVRMTSRYFAAFSLYTTGSDLPARFGFTVPKAIGKSVQRNRVKRRMRAAVQSQMTSAPNGWSVVFNPRRSVLDASYLELCQEVGRILARCKQS